jgi:hypothetical protein
MLEAGEASAADGEWAPKIRAVTGRYLATACILTLDIRALRVTAFTT